MKLSFVAASAAIIAGATALPSRHYANNPAIAAYDNVPLASSNEITDARANREAIREERRKEWQEWAHEKGANGVPNGTNFVAQILDGVSGIVDSALGPLYSVLASA
ncbi:hypothetical protein LPJ78_002959 [Coemansia sp. RSA 989]|nr:hypothetical protein BX667DRAFT_494552 [Coemansia mojavensis]KAJ1741870.1 hypothetical protein LPJ68_002421 [Coemansia sp. RSA 1086]KAJ1750467.1 hypothetical protein LPJ79_002893 [Coemansia sp. RSA 1821]KAJ1865068.1 hypothetical protein LPJ78_002959 [Coemansia sp. RSA 989]KAJ2630468.1 hypothetical protein H4R22_002647 [Coemansia sp. RSA 1290]KAJ2652732.1 hypothetical protein IWW40_000843 [Coemansia sp. RSA 1250]KAJ2675340.1 hypothetical protein IWW42_001124 [Coemansia sp. RSA 1085]